MEVMSRCSGISKNSAYYSSTNNLKRIWKRVPNDLLNASRMASSIWGSIKGIFISIISSTAFIERLSNGIFPVIRRKYTEEIRNYNALHTNGNAFKTNQSADWMEDAEITVENFPSNPDFRPGINFEHQYRKENSGSRRKNFRASESYSPGILTVQSVCKYPKFVGTSIMKECEGTITVLCVLLPRFQQEPKIFYYDDSCNLAKSIILRPLCVNDSCLIVSDRFHYRGHKRNIVCGSDRYDDKRFHSNSVLEFMNQQWNFSKSHIRFLSHNKPVTFLALRAIFVNIGA